MQPKTDYGETKNYGSFFSNHTLPNTVLFSQSTKAR